MTTDKAGGEMNVPKQEDQPTPTDRKQQLIDVSNLRFYGRLFEEYKWSTSVLHWGVFVQTLNEIASRIENAPDGAAAKLAQPEEPKGKMLCCYHCGQYFVPAGQKDERCPLCWKADPARVEQPASEGGGASGPKVVTAFAIAEMNKDKHTCGRDCDCACGRTYLIEDRSVLLVRKRDGHCNPKCTCEFGGKPTPPATGEAADSSWLTRKEMWDAHDSDHSAPAPIGDVEQAELPPPDVTDADIEEAMELFQDDFRVRQLAYYVSVERHYRAERAAHKATRKQLLQTHENLVIVRMQDYAELSTPEAAYALYSLWQDALHKPHSAHPENRRIMELEAENQELRRKVEEIPVQILDALGSVSDDQLTIAQAIGFLILKRKEHEDWQQKAEAELATMREDYGKACETIARLTAKEGQ